MRVLVHIVLPLLGLCQTRIRGHVPRDKDTRDTDIVTEHFARTRPGTVPRLPASLFLESSSPQANI